MCARVVLVLVLLRAVAIADPPPPIEAALAQAAAAGKPLVVEFGAAWCLPCRNFEQHVLTLPAIAKALVDVEYVRYDIDVAPGDAAARRYGVTSVPAFVVLDADGTVRERHVGAGDGAEAARWFEGLLSRARTRTASSADLERRVAAHPDDVPARLRLASHYRAVGRVADAVLQLRAIIALPNVDRSVVATTTAELDDIVAAEDRLQGAVVAALAFVTKFPESGLTTPRLAILAATGRIPAAQLADLVHDHLDKVPLFALPDAIRVALLVGASTEAKLALSRLTPGTEARLLGAEVGLVLRDDVIGARKTISDLCAKPPRGLELRCYALEAFRGPTSAGVAELAEHASTYVRALETPVAPAQIVDLSELSGIDLDFGNVLARGLHAVRERCADKASGPTHATVLVVRSQPPASRVTVRAPPNVARCVHEQLDDLVFPSGSERLDNGVYARIDIGSKPGRWDDSWPPSGALAPAESGAVVFASARVGDIDAAGIGVTGLADAGPLGALRLLGRAELEVGRGDSTTYAVRALVGLGMPARGASVAVFVGLGPSRLGNSVPYATEFPIELDVKVPTGPVRGHFWVRSTRVFGAEMRKRPPDSRDIFGGDEYSVGVGASLPLRGQRLFVGASVERRALGTNGLFVVGVPLRTYY